MSSTANHKLDGLGSPKIGENWQFVTNKLVEFEK